MCNGFASLPAVVICSTFCWISANVLLALLVCISTKTFLLHEPSWYRSVSIGQILPATRSGCCDWPVDGDCTRLQLQHTKIKGAISLHHIWICLLVYVDLIHTAYACMAWQMLTLTAQKTLHTQTMTDACNLKLDWPYKRAQLKLTSFCRLLSSNNGHCLCDQYTTALNRTKQLQLLVNLNARMLVNCLHF